MKLLLSLFFVLIPGWMADAQAVSVPFMEQTPQVDPRDEDLGLPEPIRLEATWWQYFAVAKGETLEKRIEKTVQRLQGLLTELPAAMAQEADPLVERIRNNLHALPAARAQPAPRSPVPAPYQESYTISEFLDIAEQRREAQAELQSTRYDVDSSIRAVRAAQQRIDTVLAAYLNLELKAPERITGGLRIMADRSALALAEEQLRVRRAVLQAGEARVLQLQEKQAVAAERLVADQLNVKALDARVEQARTALVEAQEQLLNAEAQAERASADTLVTSDPEEQASAQYRRQQALQTAVEEAIARVRLTRLEAERQLVLLLLGKEVSDVTALHQRIAQWWERLKDIRRQAELWTRESERERNQVAEAMGRGTAGSQAAALTFMRLLNQDRLNLAQQTLVTLQRLEEAVVQAELIIEQANQELAHREGRLQDWLAQAGQALQRFWMMVDRWFNLSLFKLGGTPVTALGLLRVGIILLAAWWISHWLRRALNRFSSTHRVGINQSSIYTVGRLSHYFIITVGFMVGLSSIGVDFTNFALVAGAIGIGIGFGLQSIVSNFVSGLILLFERTLKVGDFVELESGIAGEVRSINVRSTLINTNDNVDVVVPNSKFINNDVINWTLQEDYRRIHIPFRVAYGTDRQVVDKAVLEAVDEIAFTLKARKPSVWLVEFGENNLNFELVVWVTPEAVKRPGAVSAAYNKAIEAALRKYGIEIPLPQRELRLRSGYGGFTQVSPSPPEN